MVGWKNDTRKLVGQFLRFGAVGVSNTAVAYATYAAIFSLGAHYLAASIISFVASVSWSFFWNNKFVFRLEKGHERNLITSFLKVIASYALTGLIIANALLVIEIEHLGMNGYVAPLMNLLVTVPLNFVLNRNWAFKSDAGKRVTGRVSYFATLSFACLLGIALVSLPATLDGRGFILQGDGLAQHLNTLTYLGIQIRAAARGLLAGNGLIFPQYIFNVGYGIDLTSLSATGMCIYDPLNWLSAAVPSAYTEYLYYALILVRTSLAASTFSFFCFRHGVEQAHAFVGSMCYAFCGYSVFLAMYLHPYFLNTAYLLPLLLIGADKIFEGESPNLFVAAIAYSLLVNAYFGYMLCLALVVYCFVRYFTSIRDKSPSGFARLVTRFLAFGSVGVLIAGVSLVPFVMGLSSLERLDSKTIIPVVFNLDYYLDYVASAIGGRQTSYDAKFIGAPTLILALIFLCGRKHADRSKWMTSAVLMTLCFAGTLIPYVSHAFNGFSYVSDRWFFFYGFSISYCAALAVPLVPKLLWSEWRNVTLLALAALVLSLLPLRNGALGIPVMGATASLAAALGILIALPKCHLKGRTIAAVLSCTILLCAGLASFNASEPNPLGANRITSFLQEAGTAKSLYSTASPYRSVDSLDQDTRALARYSMNRIDAFYQLNESLNRKRSGLSCYTSIYSQPVDDFRTEMGLPDSSFSNYYSGNDSRFALDCFSGARFFLARRGEESLAPATYEATGAKNNGYGLFESDYALPFVFSTGTVFSRREYEKLSMVAKQIAVASGCVLDDSDIPERVTTTPIATHVYVAEADMQPTDGVFLTDATVDIGAKDRGIDIAFEAPADVEVYISFRNLRLLNGYPGIPIWQQEAFGTGVQSYTVTCSTARSSNSFSAKTPFHRQYCAKNSWVLNMGRTAKSGRQEVPVRFSQPGNYSFDGICVEYMDVSPIAQSLRALQEGGADSIEFGTDSLKAIVSSREDVEYAVVSFAYSKGWSARVDGNDQELLRADAGFMALELDTPGEHVIELIYHTPGSRPGLVATLTGIALFATIAIRTRSFGGSVQSHSTSPITQNGNISKNDRMRAE